MKKKRSLLDLGSCVIYESMYYEKFVAWWNILFVTRGYMGVMVGRAIDDSIPHKI